MFSQLNLTASVSSLTHEDQIVNFQEPGQLNMAASTCMSPIANQVLALPESHRLILHVA